MRVDVLSVREAREQLPSLLDRFRGGDRTPVFLGSHRRTEAVLLSIDVYEELTAARRNAVAQGNASLRAEGLDPPTEIEAIVDQWVHSQITTAEMEQKVAALYGLSQ